MTCHVVTLPDGKHAIVCMSDRPRRCRCGARATLLCDYPVKAFRTCDRPICRRCATEIGEDRHLCPEHRKRPRQEELGL